MIELRLPFPVSVNDMYLNNKGRGRGRVKSPEYRAWLDQAAWELGAQKPKLFEDRAVVKIDLDDTRQGDADNRCKPVLDFLVSSGVLRGDSKKYVAGVETYWRPVTGCRVRIERAA